MKSDGGLQFRVDRDVKTVGGAEEAKDVLDGLVGEVDLGDEDGVRDGEVDGRFDADCTGRKQRIGSIGNRV